MARPGSDDGIVKSRESWREATRFIVAGGLNTGLTLALYWALKAVLPYLVAYTISFAVGIVLGFALNTYLVFRVPWSWRKFVAYPSIHAVNYVFSTACIYLLVERLGIAPALAPVLTLFASVPLVFFASRVLMRTNRDRR